MFKVVEVLSVLFTIIKALLVHFVSENQVVFFNNKVSCDNMLSLIYLHRQSHSLPMQYTIT